MVFGWKVCHTHAGRTAGKAGRELHSELFGPEAQVEAARRAPPKAPELMILVGDGSSSRCASSDTANYPEYRRKGWPIGSGTVESACGLIGERVKHARMRRTRRLAEATHAIKAAIMSEDGRWGKRWPPPVPVLQTRAFATAA